MYALPATELDTLIHALASRGYEVVGPTVRDGAIVYDAIESSAELPRGISDEQAPGRYRLTRRDDDAYFGFVVGPHSFKKYLFPPELRLFRIARDRDGGFTRTDAPEPARPRAFLGVRGCEIAAIEIQDRVFLGGPTGDADYRARRDQTFVVAVACTTSGASCFCTSMGTGPEVDAGFDLALTEVMREGEHVFVVQVGSERGREVLGDVPHRDADETEVSAAAAAVERAGATIARALDTRDLRDRLFANLDHPRWDDVASRCLSCGNCTMVCPTCFCSSVTDTGDLAGDTASRHRRWDSCFSLEHSALHGAAVRGSTRARYRQWLTHKLAGWIDQFGTSGCVGCGRCITWCPVGIDLTEEAAAIARSPDRTGRDGAELAGPALSGEGTLSGGGGPSGGEAA